jgi:sec-independent protein translocase protein TatB
MFDVGFSEIMVIAVVALIVIGPEKLPKTARTLGHLFGRLQRYVNDVKADINREIELDELRKLQQQVQTAAKDFETTMTTAAKDVESGVRSVESELNAAAQGVPPPPSPPPVDMLPLSPPAADPAPISPEPAPAPAEPARQASLPGFERG